MPTDHRYALPQGHHLGEYRIERYLGSGGFGITYLATDSNLNTTVAIKEYLPFDIAMRDTDNSVVVKTAENEEVFQWGRERFLEEARSLAQFNHPNIVRIQRFFEVHSTDYIVMDYIEGEPLSKRIRRRGTLTETEIHQQVLPLANGLAEIHAVGLLHRDIKPSNIVICNSDAPVLIDFGSARQAIGTKSRSVTSVVTPGYAPIEQYATRSKQGPATDIYALGAVLYRCVTGKVPDDATDRVIDDRLTPSANAVKGNYSADLLAAIDAALSVRMEDRPGDIATFLSGFGGCDNKTPRTLNQDTVEKTPKPALSYVDARSALDKAFDAVPRGDYPTALREFERLAKQGNPIAQFTLGEMYREGKWGVFKNYARSNLWYRMAADGYRKAAEQGDTEAQCALSFMYLEGQGIPKDSAQSEFWSRKVVDGYRKAAWQGDPKAQHQLGVLYYIGHGVPENHAQAANWYRRAAEQGDAEAQCNLGIMYKFGFGVREDCAQAVRWYRKAANQGDVEAQKRLACMYERGDGVSKDYAKRLIWYRKAAEQGDAEAQYAMGDSYYYAQGVLRNYERAVSWYRKAAERGEIWAQIKLCMMYADGDGVPQDCAQALIWYRKVSQEVKQGGHDKFMRKIYIKKIPLRIRLRLFFANS